MMSIDLNEQIVSQAADEQQMNYKVFSFILYQKNLLFHSSWLAI